MTLCRMETRRPSQTRHWCRDVTAIGEVEGASRSPHTGPLCRNLKARSPQGATNVRPPRGPPRGPALLLGHFGGVQWCLSIGLNVRT
ncbi:hypothetical protein ACOMHN_004602 [Nucella lapillus]